MATGREWDPEKVLLAIKDESEAFSLSSEELAAQKFKDNVAFAADTIIFLAQYSDSERMRYDAAKYIVDRVQGPVSGVTAPTMESDPFMDFIAQCVVEQRA